MKRSRSTPKLVPDEPVSKTPVVMLGGAPDSLEPEARFLVFVCPQCSGLGRTHKGCCPTCKGKRLVKLLVQENALEQVFEVRQTGGGEPPSGEVKERLLDGYERDQVPPPVHSKRKGASS